MFRIPNPERELLKLSLTSSFKIAKAMKAIDKELTEFDEIRNKRIKELGEPLKDDKG